MQQGLTVAPIWYDDDILELRVSASNGNFSGSVDLYAGHLDPSKWATLLSGFPATPSDTRKLNWGAPDGGWAGGYAKLVFYCLDRSGHAGVDVLLVSAWTRDNEAVESAKVSIRVEAASVDAFTRDLAILRQDQLSGAILQRVV
jgi:hypothetical protein